ncbi:SURF1 family cytochrome oxidase biogenesis protein [Microlunatus soli]|uniref:SURF1 family cytochrome oxidase biogenesis protein n=1 Tax=Microlunatus soli TaxID=630515 RepID=UPI001E6411CC|nr:SURF1 family protein [Microlunatus soli]
MSQQATDPARPTQQHRRPQQRRPQRRSGPPPAPKYPLWVRWVALALFVAVLGVTFVKLGQWQLRRLDERRAGNVVVRANERAPVAEFSDIFSHPIGAADEWKRVRVTGTFDADRQFVIRYRDNSDDSGYEVVAPLRTSDGRTVLIDRGFIPVDGGQRIAQQAPPPPTGTVTVVGRVRADETGRDSATVPVNGHARLINSGKIGSALGRPVVNGYIDALTMDPADPTTFAPIDLPELNDGPHFWYAVQWFMFTGIGVLGVVVFIRGDLRDRRERRAAAAKVARES